ncbi:hypothetical protein BCU70_10200 [Vibrio sp. 10N.286.49.C2]|uniref:hypothetical protein n=1 Tax=unclassified Vibrio TaxID=2614977 RepID=UPI000C82A217|nr:MULTISPECIES: hypothetical protein [unclassified Vibrio]PMH26508.1 hypothetical protein BCU70_10200 [Vibrio sp. 10N.286.49.C2]PMH54768.1 hypothetical protein BCU66_10735 [Vibrio sp. 10N.286.49.B1]PMH82509.1 hypothetical protein BCU58_17960 [Vibrio sp. 10N.286.48.B7]
MKVLIQYTQTGKYKDQAWDSLSVKAKGEIQAVTPSYAAQLIEQNRANLLTTNSEEIVKRP